MGYSISAQSQHELKPAVFKYMCTFLIYGSDLFQGKEEGKDKIILNIST